MEFLVVGDLHGHVRALSRIDQFASKNRINLIIQVGDLGYAWPGEDCCLARYFYKRDQTFPEWCALLGNHDNYDHFKKAALRKTKRAGVTNDSWIKYKPGLFVSGSNPRIKLGEQGYTGLQVSNGQIYEEANRELRWPNSIKTFKKMSRDATISAALDNPNIYEKAMRSLSKLGR